MSRKKPDWHEKARKMRGDGMVLREIAKKFGVTVEAVRKVVVDVKSPVDHKRKASGDNLSFPPTITSDNPETSSSVFPILTFSI